MKDDMGCIFLGILVVVFCLALFNGIDYKSNYLCNSFGVAEQVNVQHRVFMECWVETDLGYVKLDDYMARVYGDE